VWSYVVAETWASLTADHSQKNEGPDFYVEVEKVPVPEIGMRCSYHRFNETPLTSTAARSQRCPDQAQRHRPLS
jgi:hypothetical protein